MGGGDILEVGVRDDRKEALTGDAASASGTSADANPGEFSVAL